MDNKASLLSKQSMGGIIGEGGYNFQDAYILTKIPEWMCDSSFMQILKEGSSDVDVAFNKDKILHREYTQIKDHNVTPGEFREVLKQFIDKDTNTPHTYQKFVLASTGLSSEVTRLKTALDRIKGARDFFTSKDMVIKDTYTDLKKIAKELEVENELEFIIEKVEFENDLPGLTQLRQIIRLFCGGMLDIESYRSKSGIFRHMFHPLYTYLVDSTGKTINRSDLEAKINEFIDNYKQRIEEDGFTVRMYHWEDTPYELNLKYDEIIDWSEYFERATRKTPEARIWNENLLPELINLQKRIRQTGQARLIKFEGSATLSAGIAFGSAFPEVAGYTIQLAQRLGAKVEDWRSDVEIRSEYRLNSSDELINEAGQGLAVKFNVVADVSDQLDVFINESVKDFKASLTLQPQTGIGEFINNESAVAYARDAKRLIRQAIGKYKTDEIHLFFAGPLGMAIFFGQMLNAMPEIQCYEQNISHGYKLSCTIKNN